MKRCRKNDVYQREKRQVSFLRDFFYINNTLLLKESNKAQFSMPFQSVIHEEVLRERGSH